MVVSLSFIIYHLSFSPARAQNTFQIGDKTFLLKPTVNAQLNVDTVKFYKLHAFHENDFFEQPALVYTLIENDVQKIKV